MEKNFDKDLLDIINYYGGNHQLRKLKEEQFELDEAIIIYERSLQANKFQLEHKVYDLEYLKRNVTEEFVDNLVLLFQFKEYLGIDGKEIIRMMNYKINRTKQKIEEEKNETSKINKAIDKLICWGEALDPTFQNEMMDILTGVSEK